ncbi:hypothetical protein SAEN111111_14950 [Saccharibacillus endophyticus]
MEMPISLPTDKAIGATIKTATEINTPTAVVIILPNATAIVEHAFSIGFHEREKILMKRRNLLCICTIRIRIEAVLRVRYIRRTPTKKPTRNGSVSC